MIYKFLKSSNFINQLQIFHELINSLIVNAPNTQSVHSTLVKTHFDRRLKMMSTGEKLDWATCESLAFGSLLYDGSY